MPFYRYWSVPCLLVLDMLNIFLQTYHQLIPEQEILKVYAHYLDLLLMTVYASSSQLGDMEQSENS